MDCVTEGIAREIVNSGVMNNFIYLINLKLNLKIYGRIKYNSRTQNEIEIPKGS